MLGFFLELWEAMSEFSLRKMSAANLLEAFPTLTLAFTAKSTDGRMSHCPVCHDVDPEIF